jgi:LPS sulfotransferase NodH
MEDNMQKFVVLFVGRCGGTWLSSMIRNVPQVYMQNEVFAGVCRNLSGKNDTVPYPDTDAEKKRHRNLQSAFLERATIPKTNKFFKDVEPVGDEIASGFLLKYRQILHVEDFVKFVHDNDCKVIYLKRENILQQAISYFGGFQAKKINGSYNVIGSAKPVETFEVNPQELISKTQEFDRDNQNFENFLSKNDFNEHWITYEDMLADVNGQVNGVLRHIGVESQSKFTTNVKKNLKNSIKETLENYDECYESLSDTPYIKFLN